MNDKMVSDMKKVSTILTMLAASEAMAKSYDYECRGSDLLISKKDSEIKVKQNHRKVYYTAESPEVKVMSIQK